MRDRITHRGPDDAGLWENRRACIGHRRLSIIDPGSGGHQPMVSADGRYVLAYNGELYNDHDLRAELASMGSQFRSGCDTETFLHALITWGDDAIQKIRGMYAFLFLDTHSESLIMARDPLGIKPLYYAILGNAPEQQMVVASEISAILEHPSVDRTPDPVTLSAYLSTIRTTLGDRTMYSAIRTLEPGDWVRIDLNDPTQIRLKKWWESSHEEPTQGIRQTIEESVHRHLRSDVPMCALLSGGIDSAITSSIAMSSLGTLHTYCAGARSDGFDDDFAYARQMADFLGTTHTEVDVTQEDFVTQLPKMIRKIGYPMSTPNEVAIHAVARVLRAEGHLVTLSGEGADELFGGYVPIMQQCAAHVSQLDNPSSDPEGGLFHLRANAWVSEELKPGVLNPIRIAEADNDEHLRAYYMHAFQSVHARSATDSPLQAHLQFQRRMNLPNLLQRLDTATMLAGVEGRTPFADIEVAIAAQALPIDRKFVQDGETVRSKIAIREAFQTDLPESIVNRPKASFPLPFQQWLDPFRDILFNSPFARQYFTQQAIGLVSANPCKYWHMAWPMINLTIWGQACVIGDEIDTEQLVATSHSC
jgi:asparagine synthase (glutamine-hydrolysing)